jgi:DNA-3-methyladenine glycosylase I
VNSDAKARCWWPDGIEVVDLPMLAYHDSEWGVPVSHNRGLFERLSLEGFQAGPARVTILRKCEASRATFDGFDPETAAHYHESDRAGPSMDQATRLLLR